MVIAGCAFKPPLTPNVENEDLNFARSQLIQFYDFLAQQKYDQAATLFGGDLDILRGYNPDLAADDFNMLFKRACVQNGFQCLSVKQIINEEIIATNQFVFTVEYQQADGNLFVRGACCGASEEEMPPVSQFSVQVERVDGEYKVLSLPPYVP